MPKLRNFLSRSWAAKKKISNELNNPFKTSGRGMPNMGSKGNTTRSSVLDAIYVLNDLVDALATGTMVFDNYQSMFARGEFSQPGIVGVQKMCVSHLILGLNKFCEFWESFHHLVPTELRPEIKVLVAKLQNRDVKKFRNTVVAH